MPWCPKCKNEYREGIAVCTDCGCELVDSLEESASVRLIFGEEEQMNALKEFLEQNKLNGVQLYFDEEEEVCELLVHQEDHKKAAQMTKIFLQQEEARTSAQDAEEADVEEVTEADSQTLPAGVYQDSAERAEDNRSSAWTLLAVGGVGLIAMILGFAGVLPIHLTGTNKYMVYGIMSALFLLFLVMGVVSMKNSKIFAQKAESENTLRDTLNKWCRENLIPDTIDAELDVTDDIPEEILYFKRFEKMKEKLKYQFVNLDDAFLEHFIDEQYDAIFRSGKDTE